MENTRLPVRTIDEAFSLFDQEESLSAIGRALSISRRTVARWRDQLDWVQRREKNREAAGEVLDAKCVDRRVELAEKAQDGLEKVLDRLSGDRSRDVDKLAKAALDLGKLHNLLVGAPTEVAEHRIITVQDLLQAARERPALREGDGSGS